MCVRKNYLLFVFEADDCIVLSIQLRFNGTQQPKDVVKEAPTNYGIVLNVVRKTRLKLFVCLSKL